MSAVPGAVPDGQNHAPAQDCASDEHEENGGESKGSEPLAGSQPGHVSTYAWRGENVYGKDARPQWPTSENQTG
jgi:hypothetical protein